MRLHRDLDHRQDATSGTADGPELISTGGSPFDSSLLGRKRRRTDAFFFTRDTLVPQDEKRTLAEI